MTVRASLPEMHPKPAWTTDMCEKNYKKLKSYVLQKRSFLAVIRPIAWLATFTGISGVSVKCKNGQYTARVSSKMTIRYSYGVLVYSIIYQSVALYFYYYEQKQDVGLLMYMAMRTMVTTAIHLSMLLNRRVVSQVLQREHDLGVEIPVFITALPFISYIVIFITSVLSASLIRDGSSSIVGVAVDLRPPIFNVFGAYFYGSQAAFFVEALKMVNSELQELITTHANHKTLRPIIQKYLLLRQVCCNVNRGMGTTMLLASVTVSCELVNALFLSFIARNLFVMGICVSWALVHTIPGGLAMLACQHVETTYQTSSAMVVELRLQQNLPKTIKREAKELQVQLKQMPLTFSAGGWISLNGSQIKAGVSAVITYTVILVQNMKWEIEEFLPYPI